MGIGVSIFLLAAGAILTFAVEAAVAGIDLDVVGTILMAVGAPGLVMTLLIWGPRRRIARVEHPVVAKREVVEERRVYDDPALQPLPSSAGPEGDEPSPSVFDSRHVLAPRTPSIRGDSLSISLWISSAPDALGGATRSNMRADRSCPLPCGHGSGHGRFTVRFGLGFPRGGSG